MINLKKGFQTKLIECLAAIILPCVTKYTSVQKCKGPLVYIITRYFPETAKCTGRGIITIIPVRKVQENCFGNSGVTRTGTSVMLSIPVRRLAENPWGKNKLSVLVQHYMCNTGTLGRHQHSKTLILSSLFFVPLYINREVEAHN